MSPANSALPSTHPLSTPSTSGLSSRPCCNNATPLRQRGTAANNRRYQVPWQSWRVLQQRQEQLRSRPSCQLSVSEPESLITDYAHCSERHAAMHGYSRTSSARASSDGGTSRPSAFAVFMLITRSYLVGACTGRSAGLSPLRMRPV